MILPVALNPEARAEFDTAADWYKQQHPDLGSKFIARVHTMLDEISRHPQ